MNNRNNKLRVITNVGGYLFFFLVIVWFRYLKIKNSNNRLNPILLFLGDLKNGPGLRNPKKDGYGVGVGPGVRVCD